MKKQLLLLYFSSFVLFWPTGSTAQGASPHPDPSVKKQLDEIKAKAQGQVDNNLNRFGFATLKYYNQLSDTFFAKECADTVNSITAAFESAAAEKLSKTATYKKEIGQYGLSQQAAQSAFTGLFRKSLLALAVWLTLVIIILRLRNRKVRKSEDLLQLTKHQAQYSESNISQSKTLLEAKEKTTPLLLSAIGIAGNLSDQLREYCEQLPAEDERLTVSKELKNKVQLILTQLTHENRMFELAESQTSTSPEEKAKCSINELCDHLLDIAFRGNFPNDGTADSCTVTRDLEKNLPPIQLYPKDAGEMLLIVFDNAFKAVKDRASRLEKGYQPKVAVSTRILPRFIQIRVKDNGDGIPEPLREKVTQEFMVHRADGRSSGTGLALINELLRERNKGELKIESEIGKGTDIYLKFFL